jgi:hypothetical protein
MEGLTRLVSDSLARHGFDRPLDYRRLHWSRWFRCESHHSLLCVPSKPGVFALAEEIINLGTSHPNDLVETAAPGCPAEQSSAGPARNGSGWHGSERDRVSEPVRPNPARPELARTSAADSPGSAPPPRRMLAVTQFFEDEDMAFVLDRMLSRQNPMRARLISGRYFVRFVVIEDPTQRRTICDALNQWMVSAAEKATGIGSHFASSLELTPATEYIPPASDAQPTRFEDANSGEDHGGRTLLSAHAGAATNQARTGDLSIPAMRHATAPQLDSGAATNIHCPSPFPSGF